jgi:hypothetical protein
MVGGYPPEVNADAGMRTGGEGTGSLSWRGLFDDEPH